MILLITVLAVQQTGLGFNYELLISGAVASLNIVLLLFAVNIKRLVKAGRIKDAEVLGD